MADALPQQRVKQHGLVNCPADEARGKVRQIEVDDPLTEAGRGRGTPVVRDLRRKQCHCLMQDAVLVPVQVIADHSVIDDQQRPRLVRVHGVHMARHVRVEDLGDTGNLRSPCPDLLVVGHAKIVQDRLTAGGVRLYPMETSTDAAGMEAAGEPVRFDTKIVVVLRDDLEVWQRLNVTAFLVSGIGRRAPEVIGEPYADADGTEYLPMFRQPVLVLTGSKEIRLVRIRGPLSPRARNVGLHGGPVRDGQRPG